MANKKPLAVRRASVEQDYMRRMGAEAFKSFYPAVRVYSLDRSATDVDPLYGEETEDGRVYAKTPVVVHCQDELNPTRRTIDKYGFRKDVDGILVFSTYELELEGLTLKAGDVVTVGNKGNEYELLSSVERDWDMGADAYAHVGWSVKPYQRSSTSYEESIVDEDAGTPTDEQKYEDESKNSEEDDLYL